MDVRFVMFKANGTRHEFPLRKERTVVGRTNNCDLRIPLSSVSRQHCEIMIADGKVKLRDLGSSNGTYHNSTRVTAATLKAGDEIVIGPVVFTVVIDGRPAKLEAKRTVLNTDASSAGVNMAPSEAPTPSPANRETSEAMQSAASALAQVMDEEQPSETIELPGDDEPAPPDMPTRVGDDDEVLSLEPVNDDAPAQPAAGDSAMAAEEDVLTLAEEDEQPAGESKAEAIELDDDETPANVEAEAFTPTTELDDPIAALGRMGAKSSEEEIILLPDDEEDKDKKKK
jgi:pSer/pThr/pTyr-binding forkhead associated (FHA) protein